MLDGNEILSNDSKYRVAFDLMSIIAQRETDNKIIQTNPREYYITLYHQCYKVVNGMPLEDSLMRD